MHGPVYFEVDFKTKKLTLTIECRSKIVRVTYEELVYKSEERTIRKWYIAVIDRSISFVFSIQNDWKDSIQCESIDSFVYCRIQANNLREMKSNRIWSNDLNYVSENCLSG